MIHAMQVRNVPRLWMKHCTQKVINFDIMLGFCFENEALHFIALPRNNTKKLMNLRISTGEGRHIK